MEDGNDKAELFRKMEAAELMAARSLSMTAALAERIQKLENRLAELDRGGRHPEYPHALRGA